MYHRLFFRDPYMTPRMNNTMLSLHSCTALQASQPSCHLNPIACLQLPKLLNWYLSFSSTVASLVSIFTHQFTPHTQMITYVHSTQPHILPCHHNIEVHILGPSLLFLSVHYPKLEMQESSLIIFHFVSSPIKDSGMQT